MTHLSGVKQYNNIMKVFHLLRTASCDSHKSRHVSGHGFTSSVSRQQHVCKYAKTAYLLPSRHAKAHVTKEAASLREEYKEYTDKNNPKNLAVS